MGAETKTKEVRLMSDDEEEVFLTIWALREKRTRPHDIFMSTKTLASSVNFSVFSDILNALMEKGAVKVVTEGNKARFINYRPVWAYWLHHAYVEIPDKTAHIV